ncbi:MAG: serine/threonine-protein kinase [Gemmatimonadota bacterium]
MSTDPAVRLRFDSGTTATGSLPTDFMEDAGRRVSIAALATAAVWLIVAVMANATAAKVGYDPRIQYAWSRFGNELTATVIALSLALAYGARKLYDRPHLVLRLGLAYEVVCAIAVALISQWNPPFQGRGISWNAVVIMLFPAIVPARPVAVLITSVLAATAEPVVYYFAVRAGLASPPLPTFMVVWAFLPTYICAGLAVIPASIVRNLGRAVHQARELGNYRLEERVGGGGMGEVYRASHRLLARPAAVKLISPTQLGARDQNGQQLLSERFRREASAAASLRSPHTIELYDFGVAADGTLYFAMELLDGIDLQKLVDEHGPIPPARAVHLLRQACLSLGEAHRRGLVHRDIKPSNLMICRMGTEVDYLKILDFGLVKKQAPTDAQLTAPDMTAGTPAYMPPEAIDGVALLDHRADIYALGCVAYWLLTGRPVFQGSSALSILVKHGREQPTPLSNTVEPVGPDLERLVMRCLEKDPNDRPQDALTLEKELAACTVTAAWTPDEAVAWWAIHRPEAASEAAGEPDRASR